MSGPHRVTDWTTVARALASSGCDVSDELPRVLVSPESAAEDLRNALAVLVALGRDVSVPPLEAAGVRARIESALKKLESERT